MKQRTLALCLALVMALVCVSCNSANTITPTDVTGTDVSTLADGGAGESAGTSSEAASTDVVSKLDSQAGSSTSLVSQSAVSKVSKPSNSTTTKPSNTVSSKPSNNASSEDDEIVFEKFDAAKVEQLVAKYINEYRVAEGNPAATFLYGKAYQYAKLRSKQLLTNFSHDTGNVRAVAEQLQYGTYHCEDEWIYDAATDDLIATGKKIEYWTPPGSEGICRQDADVTMSFSNDEIAKRIATAYYKSPNHWTYIGGATVKYISVGLSVGNGYLCDCVHVLPTNEYD